MRTFKNLLVILTVTILFTGCGKAGVETVSVADGVDLVYLKAVGAEASSFDQTPDWAPEPDPMAPADGDMMTRWSSNYEGTEEWIYFDLGTDSVVSSVIVRWERAYATEFKILVSNDAETWHAVYHATDFKGGVADASFDPVKCRYLKVQSLSKVEENWGVSIWEVEIFGPASHNNGGMMSKQEYLGQGQQKAKAEEVKGLIAGMKESPVPLSQKPFQHGVVYTSWMADELNLPASDMTLIELKKMGFDTIAIMVPAYQDTLDSEEIFTNDREGGDTPTLESLKQAVQTCHKIGLRVMIKPHVDPRTDEARINILPSEKWFDSLEEFTLKYAKFSQKHKVEMFSVGTELEATTFDAWNHRWLGIIEKCRQVYSGVLTYSANWTEYEEVPFWNELDFIGIDAYFPLTGEDAATVEDIEAAWEARADAIEKWLTDKGLTEKGVLFTEIGYTSTDGTNRQPWVAITSVEDEQEQADCFEALFRVFSKRPWFKGYYIWQYFPQKRWSPLGFTITDKKAEEVVKKWLKEF